MAEFLLDFAAAHYDLASKFPSHIAAVVIYLIRKASRTPLTPTEIRSTGLTETVLRHEAKEFLAAYGPFHRGAVKMNNFRKTFDKKLLAFNIDLCE